MQLSCPTATDQIVIYSPSPGPGMAGTMCACGRSNIGLQVTIPQPGGPFVRVRVVNLDAPAQLPNPKMAGDVDVIPDGGGNWTANGIWVPDPDDANWELTLYAWGLVTATSGGVSTLDSGTVNFTGGGVPGDTDCCADCASGSAPGPVGFLTAALAAKGSLDVTVPEGELAGIYTASTVAALRWQVRIGDAAFTLSPCAAGKSLVIQGPISRALSKAISLEPFSAIVPGAIFGSPMDVVVT